MTFGSETYKAGVEMSTEEFWKRMVAPDAPFPKTAAASPGDFKEAFEAAFAAGAEAIVSVNVAGTLSGTIKSAQIARDMLPDREIHVVDSNGASMAQGILARMGVELADEGRPAAEIAERLEARTNDILIYVALDTLEYLKKGGRISGTSAAIGTLLSVKPIIKVKDGAVETVDKVRTRSKARERLIELIVERPIERLAILHTISPDVEAFRDQVLARAPGPRSGRRDDRPRGGIGRAASRPRLRRRGDPVSRLTRLATLRQGCDSVATRYHRGGANRRVASILSPNLSRVPTVDPDLPATDGAPRGVVRETTQIEAVDDRQTREASIP